MAIEKRTGYKVDLRGMAQYAVDAVKYIESWNAEKSNEITPKNKHITFSRPTLGHRRGDKTKAYRHNVAPLIKRQLFESKKGGQVALTTYHTYLSDIRKKLMRETGLKHHNLVKTIERLQKKYNHYSSTIQPLINCDAETVGLARSTALKQLMSEDNALAGKLYNDLVKIPVNHVLVDALVKTAAQRAKRNEMIDSNLSTRKQNVLDINYKQIQRITASGLASSDFIDLIIGVAFSTGRRAIEVIHTGSFKPSKGKNQIEFSGQAKKGYGVADTPYSVPVIVNPKAVIDAVDKLRSSERYRGMIKEIKDLPINEQNVIINRRVAGSLNKRIKELLNNSPMTFKDTRATAINIALEKIFPLAKYKKLDKNEFVRRYAGHDNYEEFKNYQHVKIDFINDEPEIEEPEEVLASNPKCNTSALEAITKELMLINKSETIDGKSMLPVAKIHEKVIKTMSENCFFLSTASIYKGKKTSKGMIKIGGSRPVVIRYLNLPLVEKAVDQFHKDNDLKGRS
jgi:hypothetical protein